MAITLVGNGTPVVLNGAGPITPTYQQATQAGNVLLAFIAYRVNGSTGISCNISGWSQIQVSQAAIPTFNFYQAVWAKLVSTASETNPTFTATGTAPSQISAQLFEVSGVSVIDQSSQIGQENPGSGSTPTLTITNPGANSSPNTACFVGSCCFSGGVSAGTVTHSAGFTDLGNNAAGGSVVLKTATCWRVNSSIVTDSDTETYTNQGQNNVLCIAMITLKPGYIVGDFFPLL